MVTHHFSWPVLGGTVRTVPTQYKATQLVVALAVWATQRSDPDFTEATSTLLLPVVTYLAYHSLDNNNVAIVKKRKKTKKRKKRKIWGRVVLENDLTRK
jgi:hypothetical protein